MTDNTDLLTLLRKLGDGKIDDLSIAHDAMEEIVHLRIRVDELYEDKEGWRIQAENYMQHALEYQAELDALRRNNAYCPMCGAGTMPSVPAPAQEPVVAAYWAVVDWNGKYIQVDQNTMQLEVYETEKHAKANVQPRTKATLVYISATPTAPAQPLTDEQIDADKTLLRQALEALDELLYANTTKGEKMAEAAVKALRERLK